MGTRVHYPVETKYQAIKMMQEGFTKKQIMEQLGIKNRTQIQTWMRWYRAGQEHRLSQPLGKQYSYGKGPDELTESQQKDVEIRQLRAKVAVLEKLAEASRRCRRR